MTHRHPHKRGGGALSRRFLFRGAGWLFAVALPLATALSACGGGGNDAEDATTPAGVDEPSGATPASSPSAVSPSPSASPSGQSASPTASPTSTTTSESTAEVAPAPQRPGGSEQDAIDAALIALDARYLSPLTRDGCIAESASAVQSSDSGSSDSGTSGGDSRPCIEYVPGESSPASGIAWFNGGDPDGGGFSFAMGQTAAGSWDYWFGTQQQTYVLTTLPGQGLACAAGAGVTIRAEPFLDGAQVAQLSDGDAVSADLFVLSQGGSYTGGANGDGWYKVSAPAEGWVHARELSDAALGDCSLRDAIEGGPVG